jgi:hypothetical protein
MRVIKTYEAYREWIDYHLATGELVKMNFEHIHDGVKPYLVEALSQIEGGNPYIKQEIKFDEIIGVTHCVKTTEDDTIYQLVRPYRGKPSRMVANRKP